MARRFNGFAWLFFAVFAVLTLGCGTRADPPQIPSRLQLSDLQGAIAFESERTKGNMEIMVAGPPNWKPVRLTDSPGFDGHPCWSPDGTRILFTSTRTGNKDLHVMNADGSSLVQITATPGDDDYAQWLPSGRIVFCCENQIWSMKPDGTDRRQITKIGVNESPHWSADETRMVFTSRRHKRDWQLYVMDLKTGAESRLSRGNARDTHGRWSPDGRRIAFSSKRDGDWNVYVMDETGSSARRVTTNTGDDWMAGWSSDGHRLLIASEFSGKWNVYVIGVDGSNLLAITSFPETTRAPAWSPVK